MKFCKKPVVIDAIQYDGTNAKTCGLEVTATQVGIQTLEGFMEAKPGDWIITDIQGERYPCKPDIFEATYEPVGNEAFKKFMENTYPEPEGVRQMFETATNVSALIHEAFNAGYEAAQSNWIPYKDGDDVKPGKYYVQLAGVGPVIGEYVTFGNKFESGWAIGDYRVEAYRQLPEPWEGE